MAQLNFGGTVENVVIRDEFPLEKACLLYTSDAADE